MHSLRFLMMLNFNSKTVFLLITRQVDMHSLGFLNGAEFLYTNCVLVVVLAYLHHFI